VGWQVGVWAGGSWCAVRLAGGQTLAGVPAGFILVYSFSFFFTPLNIYITFSILIH
jgi:hypothetical protein